VKEHPISCEIRHEIKFSTVLKHFRSSSPSNDGEDITIRKHSFIGQVNNILCYFGKLSCFVKYYLFHAYCTSYYGCELWSLSNSNVKEFCVAWRKSLIAASAGSSVSDSRCSVTTFVSIPSRLRRNMSAFS